MSSVLHPVGPERRGTYWRRRLVLVAVLVLLVVLAVLGIRALTGGDGTAPASTTTTLDPDQVSPSPVASPAAGTATGGPTASPTGSATAGTQAVAACGDGDVKVVLTTDSTAYGPAGPPRFTLAVYNESASSCQVEAGSAVRSFSVSDASGAVVWRSGDCQAQTSSQVFTLAPEEHQSMTTTWSRQRSQAGCPTDQAKVDPGPYTVSGTWKDVEAPSVQFSITG